MHEKWVNTRIHECIDVFHDRTASGFSAEIPLYHILNARITFNNLNGCDDGLGLCADNDVRLEEDEERETSGISLPSPGSDSSSVSSSTSKNGTKTTEITEHSPIEHLPKCISWLWFKTR